MKILILLGFVLVAKPAFSKLKIVTTTKNLESIVKIIGGDKVETFSFCRGTQDPHYLEAKPSYMLKASRADLLISIGLDLEVGWLPLIIRGARNPKLKQPSGSLVVGDFMETLERPQGEVTRADGDVHPGGNPHFLLDPLLALKVSELIKNKLSIVDPKSSVIYNENLEKFKKKILEKMKKWKKRVPNKLKVITYHKTLSYFYKQFKITNIAILEPKPGVPPTVKHIMKVLRMAKQENIKKIFVENYFDMTIAKRVAKDIKDLKVYSIPVSVGGDEGILTLIDLYESLISKVSE